MEGLVKAGAFDKIDNNRKKLFSSIPKMISVIKSKYDDKISNQSNLFENLSDPTNDTFKFDSEDKWTKKDLLFAPRSNLTLIFRHFHKNSLKNETKFNFNKDYEVYILFVFHNAVCNISGRTNVQHHF